MKKGETEIQFFKYLNLKLINLSQISQTQKLKSEGKKIDLKMNKLQPQKIFQIQKKLLKLFNYFINFLTIKAKNNNNIDLLNICSL